MTATTLNIDEKTLIRHAQAGSRKAMQRLIDRHAGLIYITAKRYAGGGEMGNQTFEDLIQDARVAFCEAVHSLPSAYKGALTTYARSVMVRRCRQCAARYRSIFALSDQMEKSASCVGEDVQAPTTVAIEDVEENNSNFVVNDECQCALIERNVMLAQCIAQLPQREQYVIRSRYGVCGASVRTQAELAREMCVPCQTFRHIEKRAITRLRQMLAEVAV